MVVSSFAIGALAVPVFGLGFVDTALTIIFINILGILPVSFFSTFGPVFGLRQMVLSRFWFGYYGVKISKFFFSAQPPTLRMHDWFWLVHRRGGKGMRA